MLYDNLKNEKIKFFKNGEKSKSNLLSTLCSEAARNTKQPSDDDVIKTIKKFIKDIEETMYHVEKANGDISELKSEHELLESFLPKQFDEQMLYQIVEQAFENVNPHSKKDFGKIMTYIKNNYNKNVDMKKVNSIVKEKFDE